MKTKFNGILTLLLVLVVQISFAQEKTISGVVSDETGPLPGASVLKKGTSQGIETDFDGKYSIKAKAGDVLVFSFVGMKTVEKTVGKSNKINVVLESGNVLDEVVVVAYGTSKKSSITGSVSQVKTEKIEMKNTADISKALASEVSGVSVINTTGQPGKVGTIRIRGFGSVNSSRAPLYVVDGLPFDGDIASIDPSDIETTAVLKDASATALYGARGANGVILITTKKGKKGTSKIEVDMKTGINTQILPTYDVIGTPEQFVELTWEGLKNKRVSLNSLDGATFVEPTLYASENLFGNQDGMIGTRYNMWRAEGNNLIDPATGKFKDGIQRKYTPDSWRDAIFGVGILTEASLKVSGGSEKTSHYTSLGYRSDEGYYIGSDFERVNVRSNILHDAKKWFKIGLNSTYSYMKWDEAGQGSNANNGFNFVNQVPPLYPVFARDENGKKIKDELLGGNLYDYGFGVPGRAFNGGINPAGALQLDKRGIVTHQIVVNPTMEFKITEDLKFITKYTGQFSMVELSVFSNPYYGDGKGIGRVGKYDTKTFSYTWNKLLTYDKKFDDHNISLLAGHESYELTSKSLSGRKSKIANYDNIELDNAIIMDYIGSNVSSVGLESYLAQIKYDYKEKYFLTLNGRKDGTSRFPNNKWGTFGAVGAGWMISKESFLENVDWINTLKLKASYGVIGNQNLLTADRRYIMFYPTFDSYTVNNLNGDISLGFNFKGNPNLTWEESKTFNTGIEFNFKNRIEGSVEYFKKNTSNLLFFKQVPVSFGYSSYPVNEGEIVNTGVEFELTGHIVDTNDLKIDVSINGAHYNNEIITMPIGGDGKEKYLEQQGIFGYQKGKSLFDYYMRDYAGVNPETGVSEWYIYYDVLSNGEKKPIGNLENYKNTNKITELKREKTSNYSEATQYFVGKSLIPDLTGGFGINIKYKGFELGSQFYYSIGGYAYDSGYAGLMRNNVVGARNWHTDILKRWTKPGDKTSVPRLSADYDKEVTSVSSRFLTDASYFGLNNASLGYNFSSKILENSGLTKLKVFVTGDNLFLFTARDGFNPNTAEDGMSDNWRYSPVSTFSVGVKVHF